MKTEGIFSLRTLIGSALMLFGIVLMLIFCLVGLSVPCVNNFYTQLPEYPNAELVETQASSLNYIGIGDLEFTYNTSDSVRAVQAWYQDNVDDLKQEAQRARIVGDAIPETWNHRYAITDINNGDHTQIILTAQCLN